MSSTRGPLLGYVLVLLLSLLFDGNPLAAELEIAPDVSRLGPVRTDPSRCSNSEFTDRVFERRCGTPLSSPCFNASRCAGPPLGSGGNGILPPDGGAASGPKIYVFDNYCSLADSDAISSDALDNAGEPLRNEELQEHILSWVFRDAAREVGALAATYESACMFIDVSWGEKEPCAVNTPLWNNGSNHVMVNFGDKGRESRPKVATSFAMDAASNMHSCLYRSGYDISLPLYPKRQFLELAHIPPPDRSFFLTTKGTLYPSGPGSEERQSVLPLHDEANGVVVSMHCLESHGEHLLPEYVDYCQQLKDTFHDYDYDSLMNTTFGLIPAGRQPATFRLAEVMSAGAIPVFIARDAVLPFREQINWPSFSFSFPPERVESDMIRTLKALSSTQLRLMQRESLRAYAKMFWGGDADALEGPLAFAPSAKLVIEILLRRTGFRGGR